MILCGIDPGLSGAVAFLNMADQHCDVHPMPTLALSRSGKNKREVDAYALADLLRSVTVGHAFVELVGPMPGQGVSSVGAFMKGYGIVLGVVATVGIPLTLVAPAKWKRVLGVPAAKDAARARASQLLPWAAHQWARAKDDGKAEATLIALYGKNALNAITRGA